jgi:hypothetical protein
MSQSDKGLGVSSSMHRRPKLGRLALLAQLQAAASKRLTTVKHAVEGELVRKAVRE